MKISYHGKGLDELTTKHIKYLLKLLVNTHPLSKFYVEDMTHDEKAIFILTDKETFESESYQNLLLDFQLNYISKFNIQDIFFAYKD